MPDYSQLTDRQRDIYGFIKDKINSRGYGPTVREIGQAFAIKSPNGVMCHLKALETKGFIIKQGHAARAIQLVDHRPPSEGFPYVGLVAAGTPIQAVENHERIQLDDLFAGPDRIVLKVTGNSMIDDHIEDGDLVVVHRRPTAQNGERVVARIDGDVTLKRFYKDADRIRLVPANPSMEPIVLDGSQDIEIVGVLVGVLRKC